MLRRVGMLSTLGTICLGMAVVTPPSVASPPPETFVVKAIECTADFEGRELLVVGYFDADNNSGGGDAEFHDGQTPVWGNVEESSVYDGTAFTLDVTFEYGSPWDDEELARAGEPGESAGTLTITGTATPSGDPQAESVKYREGNVWIWWTQQWQPLAGEGTITGASGDVSQTAVLGTQLECGGHINVTTYSATDPATTIGRGTYTEAHCVLPAETGESFLSLGFMGEEAYGSLGIDVNWESESAAWWAQGPVERSGSAITGDLEVYMPEDFAGQTAAVDLAVGRIAIDRGTVMEKGRQYGIVERFASYPLTGTVALPDDTIVSVEDCTLTTWWTMVRVSSEAGQKPGGRPPANDLPSGATELAADTTVTQSTRGASAAPEAPCLIDTGEGTWSIPFGQTVWYAFTGTGEEVLLSTVGTAQEFNTVMGVYEADTMEQVACADEGTDPKQGWAAEVLLETEPETGYLVQVGGFDPVEEDFGPEWGDLVLTRS